ncbi:protein cueball-like [Daphnia carinata]|uniref:protein cueball-like n=1 Tax=Daphnia carinata TaxID=120202 RepID=UPI00257E9206|nr:protein cueball-like [Daphnia carinata]
MRIEVFSTFLIFEAVVSLKHNDLIIAVGDTLELLSDGKTFETLNLDSYNASKLSALAYDPATKKLFFSDTRHRHGHIFSVDLNDEFYHPVVDIVEKKDNETVGSLTYDPVDKTLLWMDGSNRSIRRVKIDHETFHTEEKGDVEILHSFDNSNKPSGLICDPCTRILYWTNVHQSRPTIERSFINGSHPNVLIQNDLFQPMTLDLDVPEQKLYWAQSLRNGSFYIERSFVNGTGREEIYRDVGQIIISLAVGGDYVYWGDYTQKKLWSLRKDGSSSSPVTLGTFRNPPTSIVLRHQPLDCSLLKLAQTEQFIAHESETITIVCLTITSLIIIAVVAIFVFRSWTFRSGRTLLISDKDDDAFPFQDFENGRDCRKMTQQV